MRSQIEKNMESLMESIEEYSEKTITDAVAERLSVYRGAYKALKMLCEKERTETTETAVAATMALVADNTGTEFEQAIASTPPDTAHMAAITSILADHMESLKLINRRAYDNVMMRLREVTRN